MIHDSQIHTLKYLLEWFNAPISFYLHKIFVPHFLQGLAATSESQKFPKFSKFFISTKY